SGVARAVEGDGAWAGGRRRRDRRRERGRSGGLVAVGVERGGRVWGGPREGGAVELGRGEGVCGEVFEAALVRASGGSGGGGAGAGGHPVGGERARLRPRDRDPPGRALLRALRSLTDDASAAATEK